MTDTDDEYTLTLRNGVLLYYEGAPSGGSAATWTTTKLGLFALLQGDKENIDALIQQQGDTALLDGLCDNLAAFDQTSTSLSHDARSSMNVNGGRTMNTHRYKGIVSGLLTALLLLSAGCSSDTTAGQ